MKPNKIIIIIIIFIAFVSYLLISNNSQNKHTTIKKVPITSKPNSINMPPSTAFNKKTFSIDDPTSIWVVVNKKRPLQPKNYVPSDLVVPSLPLRVPGNQTMEVRTATSDALTQMFTSASKENIHLMVSSGYRSYYYQTDLYGGYVQQMGVSGADISSARPGYSEHQTGLAVDIEPLSKNCELQQCFADTSEGKWLTVNAYKFGFIIRYPKDKVAITGYEFEPWHIRYIGNLLSNEMNKDNVETLEEIFSLPPASSY